MVDALLHSDRPTSLFDRQKWCTISVTSKKSPNVLKSCHQKDFTRKNKKLDTFNKLPINVAIWRK